MKKQKQDGSKMFMTSALRPDKHEFDVTGRLIGNLKNEEPLRTSHRFHRASKPPRIPSPP